MGSLCSLYVGAQDVTKEPKNILPINNFKRLCFIIVWPPGGLGSVCLKPVHATMDTSQRPSLHGGTGRTGFHYNTLILFISIWNIIDMGTLSADIQLN